ncbi:MAG: hypothetical protein WD114_01420 [Phycisphaerales bacterium]
MSLVTLCVLPWSWALGMMGLWLMDSQPPGPLGDPWLSRSAGVASLCAAQLVFLLCAADRLFPRAHTALTRSIQAGLGATFLGSALVLAVASLTRGVLS